jgi:aminoglycoside 6'-N-acetyltransferase I
VESLIIRPGEARDLADLAAMRHALWPESTVAEHAQEAAESLMGQAPGSLPLVVLLAQEPDGPVVGFIEVGLRSHADGCDPSRAVGFVEGWYVVPTSRGRKVGARLLSAAEDWARSHGCLEMASDTWLDNLDSQRAHEALGFEVVDRCVHYRKRL